MSEMYVTIGVTGSGKSTFRRKSLSHLPCVSPDDFIVGLWNMQKASSAWNHARNTAIELMKEGNPFLLDGQFTEYGIRSEWAKLARGFGYTSHALIFDTPWRQLLKNQRARGNRGFYGLIPHGVVLKNYQMFRDQKKAGTLGIEFDRQTWIPWSMRNRKFR